MASPVVVEFTGVEATKKFLDKKDKNIITQLGQGLSKAAIYLQGEVKMSIAGQRAEHISVDTGRFLNSVDLKVGKEDAIVYSSLPYARKLEFGTDFKNSPRRHFTNSKARSITRIGQIVDEYIKKI